MSDPAPEQKLLFPRLKPFYDFLEPLSWLLIRCAAGLILALYGLEKIVRGAEGMAPTFVKMGYTDPVPLIYFLTFVEFVGGLGIAVGLFTRFFAAAVTIE